MNYLKFTIYKKDVQGQGCVSHPKTAFRFFGKNEKHTAHFREFVTVHEAQFPFFPGGRHFDGNEQGATSF